MFIEVLENKKNILDRMVFIGTLFLICSFPLYILRFDLFGIPSTFLEILLYIVFVLFVLNTVLKKSVKLNVMLASGSGDPLFFFGLFLLFLGALTSTLVSTDQLTSLGLFKAYFFDGFLFIILLIGVFKNKDILPAMYSFLASGSLVLFSALSYLSLGELTYDGRLQAFFNSPNFLAMSLSPVLLIALWFLFFKKNSFVELLCVVLSVLIVFALLKTQSYASFFGLSTAVVFLLFFVKLKPAIKFGVVVFLLSILLFSASYQIENNKKFQDILKSDPRSSLSSREMIWSASFNILTENNNYISGIGPGLFQEHYLAHQKDFKDPYLEWAVPYPHNILLAFWIQTGIVGFSGFVILFLWVFYRGFEIILKNKKDKDIALLAMSFFVYFFIHGTLDTTFWKNDLALTFYLFLVFIFLADKGAKDRSQKQV